MVLVLLASFPVSQKTAGFLSEASGTGLGCVGVVRSSGTPWMIPSRQFHGVMCCDVKISKKKGPKWQPLRLTCSSESLKAIKASFPSCITNTSKMIKHIQKCKNKSVLGRWVLTPSCPKLSACLLRSICRWISGRDQVISSISHLLERGMGLNLLGKLNAKKIWKGT